MMTQQTLKACRGSLFLSDFDGTLTERDFYQCALEYLDDRAANLHWERYRRGELQLFEALRRIFAELPDEFEAVWEVAQQTNLEEGVGGAVERLHANNWDVVVVSHGCDWYIRRLLESKGVELPVIANPGQIVRGKGLVMHAPEDSPYYSKSRGVDKQAVVTDALEKYANVAFAGNSESDFAAAKCMHPRQRFARSELAEMLHRKRMKYQPFERWSSIAEVLTPSS